MEPVDVVEHIMQFFAYGHLPSHLQATSKPFADVAAKIFDGSPDLPAAFADLSELVRDTITPNPETTVALGKLNESRYADDRGVALRKLLEAKDAAVRAAIAKP
jgi:hypothetical protein